jgi:hypothetical protein
VKGSGLGQGRLRKLPALRPEGVEYVSSAFAARDLHEFDQLSFPFWNDEIALVLAGRASGNLGQDVFNLWVRH